MRYIGLEKMNGQDKAHQGPQLDMVFFSSLILCGCYITTRTRCIHEPEETIYGDYIVAIIFTYFTKNDRI